MRKFPSEFIAAADRRSLDENIRALIETRSDDIKHSGLQRRYYDFLDDFHNGATLKDKLQTQLVEIRDAFFFYAGRLTDPEFTALQQKITGKEITAPRSAGRTMLYVSASPRDEAGLQIDFEFKRIQEGINRGNNANAIQLSFPLFAATIEDFMSARYTSKPSIIHFSGHGEATGLVFSSARNLSVLVPAELVVETFKGAGTNTELVFMNACYSADQASLIAKNVDYVIGTNNEITDDAAILLSENFYRFLCDGQDIEQAFANARNLLLVDFKDDYAIVAMWKSGRPMTL